jgi:hypothetical protein
MCTLKEKWSKNSQEAENKTKSLPSENKTKSLP